MSHECAVTSNQSRILPTSLVLVLVGLLDLLTTIWGLNTGCIVEANPLMARVLQHGILAFAAVKLLTLAAFVIVIEWYRRHSESSARAVGFVTVTAYLLIYLVCFWHVNNRIILG